MRQILHQLSLYPTLTLKLEIKLPSSSSSSSHGLPLSLIRLLNMLVLKLNVCLHSYSYKHINILASKKNFFCDDVCLLTLSKHINFLIISKQKIRSNYLVVFFLSKFNYIYLNIYKRLIQHKK